MNILSEIFDCNKDFVANKEYEQYETTGFPNMKTAIISCMDTRLIELLPAAMGIKNGDVKLIKNAGAMVMHPYGSVMRSLIVCIYKMEVENILVVGHDDCGMEKLDIGLLKEKMLKRGISESRLEQGFAEGEKWLSGFDNTEQSVLQTVKLIQEHPFMPEDIFIKGLIINPKTGKLREIC